jgi:hypothetical protein
MDPGHAEGYEEDTRQRVFFRAEQAERADREQKQCADVQRREGDRYIPSDPGRHRCSVTVPVRTR